VGNLKLASFLAYKTIIKGSRWTLALVILIMSLSFANLILVPSLLSGVTSALNQQQINTLYGNIIVDPLPNSYYLYSASQIINEIKQNPAVSGAAAHLNSSAFFEYNWPEISSPQDKGQSGYWNVVGIEPQQEINVTTIHQSLIAGSYLSPGDTGQVLLGVEIAGGQQADNQSFLTLGGVKVGDLVRLTFSNGVQKQYSVKGIFKARQGEANNLAFVNTADMTSVLGPALSPDSASQILVRTEPGTNDGQTLAQLKTQNIAGQIRSWLDYGGGVGGIVASFGAISSLIGGIGLLVAGIVMFIVIYINLSHRRRQIGILRAIGVSRNVILSAYLMQALLYAALGVIFGGLLLGYIIKPYFDSHPITLPIGLVSLSIDPSSIRNGILGIMAAAILSGVIPVLNITRESIIKAIWGNA
jgi:putative ABC transport system permease protein